MEKLNNYLPHQQIFFTMNFFVLAIIKNLNNLTDESSNHKINSLNVSNKYKDLLQPYYGYINTSVTFQVT